MTKIRLIFQKSKKNMANISFSRNQNNLNNLKSAMQFTILQKNSRTFVKIFAI